MSVSTNASDAVILGIVSLPAGPLGPRTLFQFDFDEGIVALARIHHVVLHPRLAEIRRPLLHLRKIVPRRGNELQPPVQERHHDIIMRMAMPAGIVAYAKTVFGYDHPVVLQMLDRLGHARHGFAPSALFLPESEKAATSCRQR